MEEKAKIVKKEFGTGSLLGADFASKEHPNPPQDVWCKNKHGRRVGVTYKFYMQHGRFHGLTLAEDISIPAKPDVVNVIKPDDVAEPKLTEEDVIDKVITQEEQEKGDKEVFICEVCGKVCKTAAGLKVHLKAHERKNNIPKKK